MNDALKRKMAGHGYHVMFGDRGVQMVGRKGKTIVLAEYIPGNRKRQVYD
jgi:hypothetical protein